MVKERLVNEESYEKSKRYYEMIEDMNISAYENAKLLGKFYTNHDVAKTLASEVIQHFPFENSKEIRIIDPFCGDGRLILYLLQKMYEVKKGLDTFRFDVTLWDIDKNAVSVAKKLIEEFLISKDASFRIEARVCDSFCEYSSRIGYYDICITNPPWGLLKPQKLFSKVLSEDAYERLKDSLIEYDSYMKKEFSDSEPKSRFGKWGTNLGRCGIEVSLDLIGKNPNGICAIVSPASLFNDQISGRLRSRLFESYDVKAIDYYSAELHLFDSADVASITIVLKNGTTTEFNLKQNLKKEKKEFCVLSGMINELKEDDYMLPFEIGIDAYKILKETTELPTVEEFCKQNGLYFTREIDETKIDKKLTTVGEYGFAKGYMVDRYHFEKEEKYLINGTYSPSKSNNQWKLVWRDVSRTSQKRRIKATILPPKYVAGNSLGVICLNDETQIGALYYLLLMMNSYVFEAQARMKMVSNHVSSGIIKQVHIPPYFYDQKIIGLVRESLQKGIDDLCLDAIAADLYGISKQEYNILLGCFGLTNEEKEDLLIAYTRVKNDI